MKTIKFGDKELCINFGYMPCAKTKIVSKVAKIQENFENGNIEVEDFLLFVAEFLLIGLQKKDDTEFAFDYDSEESKNEQIEKMGDLIEAYCGENEENSPLTLFEVLCEVMLENSFLKNLFQQEKKKLKQEKTTASKKQSTTDKN